MKIALLHDLLVKLGGAEKVLEKLMDMYPDADIFTLIYDEKKVGSVFPRGKIKHIPRSTQTIYRLTKNQRLCLLAMPKAIESLDLSEYDVVIADHSAFVHGAITKPETKFIVYYHSPVRYLWDWTNEYKRDIGWNKGIKGYTINHFFKKLRMWDQVASQRHDITLVNAKNIQKRVKKYYGLDAQVIYPNVEVSKYATPLSLDQVNNKDLISSLPQSYYLIISTLTEYKRVQVAIEAFNQMPDKNLVIIGSGDYQKTLQKLAKDNTIFTGRLPDIELTYILQQSKGLIFPGEEDFGIVPIEAFGAGKPVFAYRAGGLAETMIEGITGEFFDEKSGEDFVEKFQVFEENIISGKYNAEEIQKHASRFDESVFEREIRRVVGE